MISSRSGFVISSCHTLSEKIPELLYQEPKTFTLDDAIRKQSHWRGQCLRHFLRGIDFIGLIIVNDVIQSRSTWHQVTWSAIGYPFITKKLFCVSCRSFGHYNRVCRKTGHAPSATRELITT